MPLCVLDNDDLSRRFRELSSGYSAWARGFNSGCLAEFRLMLGLMGKKADAEDAEEWFPELDT